MTEGTLVGGFAHLEDRLDGSREAFVVVGHDAAVPCQIRQNDFAVSRQCIFFGGAKGNRKSAVVSNRRDASRELRAHRERLRHFFLVEKRQIFFSRHQKGAVRRDVVDRAANRVAHFHVACRDAKAAHLIGDVHRHGQTPRFVRVPFHPDFLPGANLAHRFVMRQKNPALRPRFHKRAETDGQQDFGVRQTAVGNFRKAHARRQAMPGIVIKENFDRIPHRDVFRLLRFVEQNIVRRISRAGVQKRAERGQARHTEPRDGIFDQSRPRRLLLNHAARPRHANRGPALRPRVRPIHSDDAPRP